MNNFKLKKGTRKLSDVPSVAIAQCLEDLEMCEKHSDYKIYMHVWHSKFSREKGQCHVCLGGSRLARIMDDPDKGGSKKLKRMNNRNECKIRSMDDFQKGDVAKGLYEFFYEGVGNRHVVDPKRLKHILKEKIDIDDGKINVLVVTRETCPWTIYKDGPDEFKSCIINLIEILEGAGL